ncbi:MAG TPA: glycerol-3-phosphate 1-O-acyltransferase PlsY [Planctomycetota bacterium]|nr:glycerol-3-phosphate 1-O-acyltransferase PlsY [Planctomycetota bacterium]
MPSPGALCLAAGGLVAAYLLGAIPFGYLAGRLRGIDVRTVGSGNIGATNVARALGRPWGIAVFLLDAGKGFAAAGPLTWMVLHFMTSALADGQFRNGLAPLYALAVSAGHNWPVFLGFRGGRGVATTAGALLALAWLPAVVGLATWAVMVAIFRYVSLASLVAALVTTGLCIALAVREGKLAATWPVWGLTAVLAVLIFVRHRANIGRLFRGEEPKIGAKKAGAGGQGSEAGDAGGTVDRNAVGASAAEDGK